METITTLEKMETVINTKHNERLTKAETLQKVGQKVFDILNAYALYKNYEKNNLCYSTAYNGMYSEVYCIGKGIAIGADNEIYLPTLMNEKRDSHGGKDYNTDTWKGACTKELAAWIKKSIETLKSGAEFDPENKYITEIKDLLN